MENINLHFKVKRGKISSYDIPYEYTDIKQIIIEDLNRIKNYIATLGNNEAKDNFLLLLDKIDYYFTNVFDNGLDVFDLSLVINDDYVLFDYYENNKKVQVIIKRNFKEYYILEEEISTSYKIEECRVYEYQTRNKIKNSKSLNKYIKNINSNLDDKVCANCDWCISPDLEDEIREEQSSIPDDELSQAGDCCLGKSNINLTCDSHYCESGIMTLRKI